MADSALVIENNPIYYKALKAEHTVYVYRISVIARNFRTSP